MKIPFSFSFFPFFFCVCAPTLPMAAQGERGAYQKLEQGCQQRRMQRGMPSECLDTDTGWPLCVPSTSFSLSVPSHLFLPHPSSSLSLSLCITACAYIYIHIYLSPLFPLADIISTTGPASVHLVPYYCISRDICERSCRLRANYECYACNSLSGRESGRL